MIFGRSFGRFIECFLVNFWVIYLVIFFIIDYFYKQRKKIYFVISRIVQNLFYGGNNLEREARL